MNIMKDKSFSFEERRALKREQEAREREYRHGQKIECASCGVTTGQMIISIPMSEGVNPGKITKKNRVLYKHKIYLCVKCAKGKSNAARKAER